MRRSWRGSGWFLGLLALLAPSVPADEPVAAPRGPFVARVLERPLPDLAMLPRRVHESADGAFEDLIRLREKGGAEAVPALVAVLEAQRGSTRIFRFAAAQALFHIGGAEAEQALEKESAADDYPWWPAIDYTFHWDMDAGERDRFLALPPWGRTVTLFHHCVLGKPAEVRTLLGWIGERGDAFTAWARANCGAGP